MNYVPRLQTKYKEEVKDAMMAKFTYKNHMQIPQVQKIVLNQGVGAAVNDKKLVDAAIEEMGFLWHQHHLTAQAIQVEVA
jgi:large subunit ribosomal protein L5